MTDIEKNEIRTTDRKLLIKSKIDENAWLDTFYQAQDSTASRNKMKFLVTTTILIFLAQTP
jgi:hypothetical protein